jgi:hypothetical protein
VGKTELALEFAHRFASDYDVAWWIPAELPTSATAALAALAGRLEVAQVADQTAMVAGLFDLLRQRDRWLLVYDNAERPERLAGLLPPGGGGQVLVTSRWSAWGSQATPLRVNVLRREESVAFLASGSGDQAALDALAELLSDLPLALEEAAAYLEETGEGLGEHLELVRGRAWELFGLDTVWLRRLYSLFFIELDTDGSTWLGRPAIPTPPGHPASAQPAAGLGAARTPGTLWTLADEDQRGRCRGEIGLAGSCMSTGELHERIAHPAACKRRRR